MARKQNSARKEALKAEVEQILDEDRDVLKTMVSEALQQALEAEMDETVGAEKASAARTVWATGPAITAEVW